MNVAERDAVTSNGRLAAPILIDVKAVRRSRGLKILEQHICDIPIAAVALYHEYLVPAVSVYIFVHDVLDGGTGAEGTDSGPAGLVAPNVLDQEVGGGGLDGDTFVTVGNFYVVDPVVGALWPVRSANKLSLSLKYNSHQRCRCRQSHRYLRRGWRDCKLLH